MRTGGVGGHCRMLFASMIGVLLAAVVCAAGDVAYMYTPELVKNQGYQLEVHQVVTSDQYVLTHHRIPFGKAGPGNSPRPPILLQHGLVGDSSAWVNHNSTQVDSLGFLLADSGFDVWLLNSRGNTYSRGHTTKWRFSPSYYDFSYHEMGIYDLPNSIDYILQTTGAPKVGHIGHSQGNTQVWVMLSEKPEYNDKIAVHISYAPVAYHTHSRNPLYLFLSYPERFGALSTVPFRSFELPRNRLMTYFLIGACGNWSPFRKLCEWMYYLMMGNNPDELDPTQLRNIYGHYPASSSMKQFTHFVQGVNRPVFAQFDYKYNNRRIYGSNSPPLYNLTRVLAPVAAFYGGRDRFCQIPDVERLLGELPNLVDKHYIDRWAHYDFLHGINAKNQVYDRTIATLKRYFY